VRRTLHETVDRNAEWVVGSDELDTVSLVLEKPSKRPGVEIHQVLGPVRRPKPPEQTAVQAAVIRSRQERHSPGPQRDPDATERRAHVWEMLDRLKGGNDIPSPVIPEIVEAPDRDVDAEPLASPRHRGARELEPMRLPAGVASRIEGEPGAGTELEQRSRRTDVATKDRELALKVRSVDRRVREIVAVADASVAA